MGDTRDVEGRDRERPGKGVREASAESSFAAGAVVAGKLRIIRTVGAGGMGKVYEVEHELTRHRRALKVLHPSASPNVVERFVREATAAARIGNPHVAETFDAGTLETGEPYLLMELLEGETLEERLRRAGPIPSGELAALIQQACVGIQAAHEAGIVHRDLKPENLFVTSREGQPFVKILDFGISKFDEGRTGAPGITRDGVMLGTPYYMSPEQVLGAATDARTDVYALGVILYESACGHRPFEAPSVEQLAVLIHAGKTIPLEQRAPSVSGSFGQVVRTAMATEPSRRFASARDLGEALGPFCTRTIHVPIESRPPTGTQPARVVIRPSQRPTGPVDEGPVSAVVPSTRAALAATLGTDPPPRPPRRPIVLAMITAAGLLLGGGAAFVAARSRPEPSAPTQVSVPPVHEESAATAVLAPPLGALPKELTPDASAGRAASAPAPRSSVRTPGSASVLPSRASQSGLAGENPFR